MVKIDGQWYHVDVTWDDPVPDKPGRVSHENFLRSDDGIRSTGHYGWTSDYTCTSTKYDKYLWKDTTFLSLPKGNGTTWMRSTRVIRIRY